MILEKRLLAGCPGDSGIIVAHMYVLWLGDSKSVTNANLSLELDFQQCHVCFGRHFGPDIRLGLPQARGAVFVGQQEDDMVAGVVCVALEHNIQSFCTRQLDSDTVQHFVFAGVLVYLGGFAGAFCLYRMGAVPVSPPLGIRCHA